MSLSLASYHLVLLDFDGLLVNTEMVHYQAYQKMLADRGYQLDWSFDKYCKIAHYTSEGLREGVYSQFPELEKEQPDWQVLYQEKTQCFLYFVSIGKVELMPGVENFLLQLKDHHVNSCVVTHSLKILTDSIVQHLPVLETIPHWITRENYVRAKPEPDGYIEAISRFNVPGGKVIGFEDTPRGMRALLGSGAEGVMVTQSDYPEIPSFEKVGVRRYRSFREIYLSFS